MNFDERNCRTGNLLRCWYTLLLIVSSPERYKEWSYIPTLSAASTVARVAPDYPKGHELDAKPEKPQDSNLSIKLLVWLNFSCKASFRCEVFFGVRSTKISAKYVFIKNKNCGEEVLFCTLYW